MGFNASATARVISRRRNDDDDDVDDDDDDDDTWHIDIYLRSQRFQGLPLRVFLSGGRIDGCQKTPIKEHYCMFRLMKGKCPHFSETTISYSLGILLIIILFAYLSHFFTLRSFVSPI